MLDISFFGYVQQIESFEFALSIKLAARTTQMVEQTYDLTYNLDVYVVVLKQHLG